MQGTEAENLIDLPEGVQCPRCGYLSAHVLWQTFSNGTKHRRANCAECGTFIVYLPQTTKAPAAPVPLSVVEPEQHEQGVPIATDSPRCTSCGKRWAIKTDVKIGAIAIKLCLECAIRELPKAIGAMVARNTKTWDRDAAKRWSEQVLRQITAAYQQALGGVT